jgi:hypothetical protein
MDVGNQNRVVNREGLPCGKSDKSEVQVCIFFLLSDQLFSPFQHSAKLRAGCYCHPGLFLPSKNPCENSGTPEPATSPVIPHFPHPPNFRGHNSEKCGTGPELFNDFRRERMRSYIEVLRKQKAGSGVVWEVAGTGRGYSSILPGRCQE